MCKKGYDKALADYNEYIGREPRNAVVYVHRGQARRLKHDYDKALADYDEAIRLDPTFVDALDGQAWLWATCPDAKYRDGRKAVDSAIEACELSQWKNPISLDVLATAYAEQGDFEKAVQYEEKASRIAAHPSARKQREDRLAIYKRKTPYRDKPEQ